MESKEKVCVFGYNFKHWKTQAGILNLTLSGFKPDHVILQDWKQLNIPKPLVRITPNNLYLIEPTKLLQSLGIPYTISDHNSPDSIATLAEGGFSLGVILGARILSGEVIEQFEKGILNLHPGLLPENRGLDTIKWAILKNQQQGVTAHLIDDKIDRGLLVSKEEIKIYNDDTLLDLYIRIVNLEQEMLVKAVRSILTGKFVSKSFLPKGEYNSFMGPEDEQVVVEMFSHYKNCFFKE